MRAQGQQGYGEKSDEVELHVNICVYGWYFLQRASMVGRGLGRLSRRGGRRRGDGKEPSCLAGVAWTARAGVEGGGTGPGLRARVR